MRGRNIALGSGVVLTVAVSAIVVYNLTVVREPTTDEYRVYSSLVHHLADDDLLATSIHVSLPHAGFDSHLTFDQILYHVVNHQTYHAGQVTTTLQRWGVDPPNLDSIFVS